MLSRYGRKSSACVPDAALVIAGDARPGSRGGVRYKPTLLKAVDDSPAKDSIIVIQGSFHPKEYLTIENAADIVVLPYEQSSQSGVLAHAFSLGKPAVVTDVGGLRAEVEASGGGVVVPRGDLEQLKEYIVLLLSNRQIRERYAQRALAYVEKRIGWKYVAGMHQSLYLSFGAKCVFHQNEFPFADKTIREVAQIDDLAEPDPATDGLLPFMLNRLKSVRPRLEDLRP